MEVKQKIQEILASRERECKELLDQYHHFLALRERERKELLDQYLHLNDEAETSMTIRYVQF